MNGKVMKFGLTVLSVLLVSFLLPGCGGGGAEGAFNTPPASLNNTNEEGRATFTIKWPDRSRLIPNAANSIKVEVKNGTASVVVKVVARPANGGSSMVNLESLPVGNLMLTATAYPQPDGTGTAQASASTPLVIHNGQTTPFSLTMVSTIDHLELSAPRTTAFIGRILPLTVSARDANGALVMLAPNRLQWTSSNSSAVTVDSSGNVMGVAPGSADIMVTDTESTKSAVLSLLSKAIPTVTFQSPVNYAVTTPGDVTVADIDNDGNLDILVSSPPTSVAIFYGHGDGTFDPAVLVPTGSGSAQVIAADIDGDGRLDIICALADLNQIGIVKNLGGRTYAAAVYYNVGTQPFGVYADDFNGDGKLDLVSSNDGSNNISVLLNQGNGTFATAVNYSAGSYPAHVTGADFNGDGKVDLAVSNYVSANVILYLGNGRGGFTQGSSYGVGSYPAQIIKGDFNGDGILDLATANTFSHTINILFGTGTGTFTVSPAYPANTYPHQMHAADFTGDGDLDIATPNNGTNYFSFLKNNGHGVLAAPVQFISGGSNTRELAIGDFNKDGKPDVVVSNENTNNISVFLNSTN